MAEKERRGFLVDIVTEEQYGGHDTVGLERALAIRALLQDVHGLYSFLLLVGDAHPLYGDVPMWTVWPRHSYSPTNCGGFGLDCRSCETDYLYADVTGNWDLDDDGFYGETIDDEGEGGIDFEYELIVGRIPVYFHDYGELDRILRHAIDYMNQPEADTAYRRKVLVPAAFYYFEGQRMIGYTWPQDVDGADRAEWFIHNVVEPTEGFAATRLYEKEGHVVSAHETDLPLTRDNVVDTWAEGYGLVFWFGHGLQRAVYRTVWAEDADGDERCGADEMESGPFLAAVDAPSLGEGRPGFVVGVSCEVGSAEIPDNLAHSLLREGAAVGMVASNNVTPGSATDYGDPDSPLDTDRAGADNIGIRFLEGVMTGGYAGAAFYEAKVELGLPQEIEPLAGKMMINDFGDPPLTLDDTAEDVPPDPDPPASGCSVGLGGGEPAWAWIVLLGAAALAAARRCGRP